jgi:LytS/YehU family sensor histidine kinase
VAAQYESLKSQVNPHFLFNSLNALTNLVYEDPDKAAKFIKQLSQVYRYVLDTRAKELVPLEEELQFLKSYLYLQEIRFDGNLKIYLKLDATKGHVAPLALQLLVENAIKHNVVSHDEPLAIHLYEQEGFVVVENVINKKMLLGEESSGLGLENIKQRYTFLSNQPVVITDSDGKFTVKLPLVEAEEI